jgi:hypothetical protein
MPPVRSKDSIGRAQPHESGHEQDAHGWVVHSMSCFFSKTSYTYCISRRNFFGDKQLRVL